MHADYLSELGSKFVKSIVRLLVLFRDRVKILRVGTEWVSRVLRVWDVVNIVEDVKPVHVVHQDRVVVSVSQEIEKTEARGLEGVKGRADHRVRCHEAELAVRLKEVGFSDSLAAGVRGLEPEIRSAVHVEVNHRRGVKIGDFGTREQ